MTQQERYKIYREEICKYCKNPNCENGKGIHIFSINGVISARCTDYISSKKRITRNFILVGKEERKQCQ